MLNVALDDPPSKQWQILPCVLYVVDDSRAAKEKEVEEEDPLHTIDGW